MRQPLTALSLTGAFLIAMTSCFVASATAAEKAKKTVYFMAGKKSHGYGSHEHFAGCQLLAAALRENMPEYDVVVYRVDPASGMSMVVPDSGMDVVGAGVSTCAPTE